MSSVSYIFVLSFLTIFISKANGTEEFRDYLDGAEYVHATAEKFKRENTSAFKCIIKKVDGLYDRRFCFFTLHNDDMAEDEVDEEMIEGKQGITYSEVAELMKKKINPFFYYRPSFYSSDEETVTIIGTQSLSFNKTVFSADKYLKLIGNNIKLNETIVKSGVIIIEPLVRGSSGIIAFKVHPKKACLLTADINFVQETFSFHMECAFLEILYFTEKSVNAFRFEEPL